MTALAPCPWPIGRLLPHAPPMLLLDAALGYDDDAASASATIRDGDPFVTARGMPAHVGIELMAQTCGVFVGAHALARGETPRLGFLLGTRGYRATVDWFAVGASLQVWAAVVYRDGEIGVFDCRIERDGTVLAQAQLSLVQPDDVDTVLKGGT